MIDYLERLFSPVRREWEEESEVRSDSRFTAEETPQKPAVLVREAAPEAVRAEKREGYRAEEAVEHRNAALPGGTGEGAEELARVSRIWEEPGFEAYGFRTPDRHRPEIREEALEHRLRRNSRRYDSGFFLY